MLQQRQQPGMPPTQQQSIVQQQPQVSLQNQTVAQQLQNQSIQPGPMNSVTVVSNRQNKFVERNFLLKNK